MGKVPIVIVLKSFPAGADKKSKLLQIDKRW